MNHLLPFNFSLFFTTSFFHDEVYRRLSEHKCADGTDEDWIRLKEWGKTFMLASMGSFGHKQSQNIIISKKNNNSYSNKLSRTDVITSFTFLYIRTIWAYHFHLIHRLSPLQHWTTSLECIDVFTLSKYNPNTENFYARVRNVENDIFAKKFDEFFWKNCGFF